MKRLDMTWHSMVQRGVIKIVVKPRECLVVARKIFINDIEKII